MAPPRIFRMSVAKVYPLYLTKVEKKGRTQAELDAVIQWLTGFEPDDVAAHLQAETSFEAAACIGCGACVAACKNASAMLFTSAKVSQFALLPQGQPERHQRARAMVRQMDAEGFGGCTNHGECEAACPKEISVDAIAMLNKEVLRANLAPR